jgi:phosphopantothenoylcysteine synthetase/decarboxylase
MPAARKQPVLYVIACGGRPCGLLPAFVSFAQAQGWDVCVIATPDGTKFLDAARLADQTGHPVRSQYKQPDEPDVLPPADALVVAPATFNTINKWARGISDTLALGLLNEATGKGLPIAAVPWPNVALVRHPAFQRSIADLREWGVRVILDPARLPGVADPSAVFPWEELRAELAGLNHTAGKP